MLLAYTLFMHVPRLQASALGSHTDSQYVLCPWEENGSDIRVAREGPTAVDAGVIGLLGPRLLPSVAHDLQSCRLQRFFPVCLALS